MIKLPPDRFLGAAEPVQELELDVLRLRSEVSQLTGRLRVPEGWIEEQQKIAGVCAINLTHLPGLQGHHRWTRHRSNHQYLDQGVREGDFTERLAELQGTYLSEVIDLIAARHQAHWGTEFQGRHQLVWLSPEYCYPMHKDDHTAHRYHVPLISDPYCWFLFETDDGDIHRVWMPADGRVWYLNPHRYSHTVVHLGYTPRLHLLLTSED